MKKSSRPASPDQPDIIRAPFTSEQVRSLNDYQSSPLHEFTCGTNSSHRPLNATRSGLRCLDCKYRQEFAWLPMTDRSWERWLLTNLPAVLAAQVRVGEEGQT
jgi:hypothetical protein